MPESGFLKRTARAVVPAVAWQNARRLKRQTRGLGARWLMGRDVRPLSYVWGFDRGLPIHRYYIEQFLEEFRGDLRGHCLEFRDDSYTHRFGGDAVTRLDILHLDDSHPAATIVADLTKPNDIPSATFDAIVCTHVLHLIFEVDKAVADLHRILKPGGVLLGVVPHISMYDPGWHEIWRFTPEGLGAVIGRAFGSEGVTIRAYGNSLTAAGELRGLVAEEFSKATLEYHDPRFAVSVCVRAVKPR
jgi:SAM-dependent methyltransferase